MKTEARIQQEIIQWFTNNYCLKFHNPRSIIFSVPNGINTNPVQAMQLKATGLLAGASDTIVVHRGSIYFCEIKNEIGVLSPEQKDFALRIDLNGFRYVVFKSLEEFQEFVLSL